MLAYGRKSLPLFIVIALAALPTSAINRSRHYSTGSSKRTTPPWWTNKPIHKAGYSPNRELT